MSDYQKKLILRFALVFFGILLLFVCVIGKIFVLQYVERKDWLRFEQRKQEFTRVIEAERGSIYDCEGRLLAQSIPTYNVYMDMRVPALTKNNGEMFHQYVDSISIGLSEIFHDRSASEYRSMFNTAFARHKGRLRIYPKRISYTQLKAVQQLPLYNLSTNKSGLIVEEWHERVKPFGSLAARTIGGIYSETGKGNSGLEMRYEKLLHGTPGKGIRQRFVGQTSMITLDEPVNGMDIITTLNADLQDIVESELRRTMDVTGGDWGCCIMMETKSGEIKAISNLDITSDGSYIESQNHAVTRMEPGSMFKTFALMAALDDNKVSLTDTFPVPRGGWIYQDQSHPITDSHYIEELNGTMTVKQGLTVSSNIVLAQIVTSSYEKKAERFVNKLDKMGLRDTFSCEIPGCNNPHIEIPKDRETLARMSFGYSVELPPLYTLAFYNAIANDGKIIAPILVKAIEKDGVAQKTFSARTLESSMCSTRTLKKVRECLESVVWDSLGTAAPRLWSKKAQSQLVHIAGKTGTARVLQNGHYLNNRHRIAFCGYFPMENPQYTCICVIHNVQGRDAGQDCGGTVRRIAERTMAHNYRRPEKLPKDSVLLPSIKRGWQKDIREATNKLDIDIERTNGTWARVNEDYACEEMNVNKDMVPNVVGMGAKDAIYAIEQTGMIAVVNGRGRVVSQSVANGSRPLKGGTVYLELR